MKNSFLGRLKNTVTIQIKGKNIERFLKRIISLEIELLDIKYVKYNIVTIQVYQEELERIESVKTIYEIDVIRINGFQKFIQDIKKNKYIIFFLILGFCILYYLCNTIFKIEVVHNKPEIRELLMEELKINGIQEYHQKKSYEELQKIKKRIIEKYKDKIEWLEIEEVGTTYRVRVEERIILKEDSTYIKRDVVAKKSALLLKVEAKKGEIVKEINQYVRQGEPVVTGNIKLYEEVKENIMADAEIYGEVWYKASVEYPLKYQEEKETGKTKKVYVIKFLNKEIELFNFNKYKHKQVKDEVLLKSNLLPFSFVRQTQKEVIEIDQDLTQEEAIQRATEKAKEKIESKLNDKEKIIDSKKLKVEVNHSKIILEIFFSVMENITEYKEIVEEIEKSD